MIIDQQKLVQVNATTFHVHLKLCDSFGGRITDQDGHTLVEKDDGYVPGFFPGNHYGDYVILDIDIDTGMIKNWKKPTKEQLEEFINPAE